MAASREGACTQHAVLLAALARARGIPARVVVGLVYTESHPGFAFHMWDEAWIGDRWIPLDATRGAGGIGAAYLKLADSSLNGQAAYSCFLPVTEVIGQAKIEILEVEYAEKTSDAWNWQAMSASAAASTAKCGTGKQRLPVRSANSRSQHGQTSLARATQIQIIPPAA